MLRSMPFMGSLCALFLSACGGPGETTVPTCEELGTCTPIVHGPGPGSASLSIASTRRLADLDGRRSPSGAYALVEITLANHGLSGMLAPAPGNFVARMADRTVRRPARVDLSALGTACSGTILIEDGVSASCLLAFEIPTSAWPVQLDFETPSVSALSAFTAAPPFEKGGISCGEITDCRQSCETQSCEAACLDKGSSDGSARWEEREHCVAKACDTHRTSTAEASEPCGYDAAGRTWLPEACDACRATVLDDGAACATEERACLKSN